MIRVSPKAESTKRLVSRMSRVAWMEGNMVRSDMSRAPVPEKLTDGVYLVGSSRLTDERDCSVYLVDAGELVLIDSGAGVDPERIEKNIELLRLDPARLSTLILTHCHIDHVGGASYFRERFWVKVVMHVLDAEAVELGDQIKTGAAWYGLHLAPMPVDQKIAEAERTISLSDGTKLVCLHTPGHTPGSLSVYLDRGGEKVLFGQDIHGPFLPEFGADLAAWHKSMKTLLDLKADILCEGHFGVFRPGERVREYIEDYLEQYGFTSQPPDAAG
jgi:glyoxylase-like metal-dependent hydrolase (beta-lactamase superfamily II)